MFDMDNDLCYAQIGNCSQCGGVLYEEDRMVYFGGNIFCSQDCMWDWREFEYFEDEILFE